MARASARRFIADQDGMRAIGAAVEALADDPLPGTGFHAGEIIVCASAVTESST